MDTDLRFPPLSPEMQAFFKAFLEAMKSSDSGWDADAVMNALANV